MERKWKQMIKDSSIIFSGMSTQWFIYFMTMSSHQLLAVGPIPSCNCCPQFCVPPSPVSFHPAMSSCHPLAQGANPACHSSYPTTQNAYHAPINHCSTSIPQSNPLSFLFDKYDIFIYLTTPLPSSPRLSVIPILLYPPGMPIGPTLHGHCLT